MNKEIMKVRNTALKNVNTVIKSIALETMQLNKSSNRDYVTIKRNIILIQELINLKKYL